MFSFSVNIFFIIFAFLFILVWEFRNWYLGIVIEVVGFEIGFVVYVLVYFDMGFRKR